MTKASGSIFDHGSKTVDLKFITLWQRFKDGCCYGLATKEPGEKIVTVSEI